MSKGKLKILRGFDKLMEGKRVRPCIEHREKITPGKPISKKYFETELDARKYFEANKHRKNIILTKGM